MSIIVIDLILEYGHFLPAVALAGLAIVFSRRRMTVVIVAMVAFLLGLIFSPSVSIDFSPLALEEPWFYLIKMRQSAPTALATFAGLVIYFLFTVIHCRWLFR